MLEMWWECVLVLGCCVVLWGDVLGEVEKLMFVVVFCWCYEVVCVVWRVGRCRCN